MRTPRALLACGLTADQVRAIAHTPEHLRPVRVASHRQRKAPVQDAMRRVILATLAEHPGQTYLRIHAQTGGSADVLRHVMARMRTAGKVRSTGKGAMGEPKRWFLVQ